MKQQQQTQQIIQGNKNIYFIEDIKQLKKNRQQIEKLLLDLKDVKIQEEQQLKELALSKQIKRRMLQTNLSDRRALGGLLGTAILGIIGLAVGLNVIGIIIGGILGALLGRYAGKRIKENTLKKKKLLNINLHVIKFAAYAQHLIEEDHKVVTIQDIRFIFTINTIIELKQQKINQKYSIMRMSIKNNLEFSSNFKNQLKQNNFLIFHFFDNIDSFYNILKYRTILNLLLTDCKMIIIFCQKLQKQERRQVFKIQRKLIKSLKKIKFLYATFQMYWIVKLWTKNKQINADILQEEKEQIEKVIAGISFNFLLPLSKLMATNRRMLSNNQQKLEQKINQLLLSDSILDLKEKNIQYKQLQKEIEEEYIDQIYREVELKQLKSIMQDEIAQELLKEDEMNAQNKEESQENNHQFIPSNLNQIEKDINIVQNESQIVKNVENTKYVVWNFQSNSCGGLNQPSFYSNQPSLANNQPYCQNQNKFQSINNKSRLIDIIQMASHQKQQEEDFTSSMSQKQVHEQLQSHQTQINQEQINCPRVLFEKIDQNRFQNDQIQVKLDQYPKSEADKQINQTETIKYQQSCVILQDHEKNNVDIQFNLKALSILNNQISQFQQQSKINNDQSDFGYIPQKFLLNCDEENNGQRTFINHTQSNYDIQLKSNQQQNLNTLNEKQSLSNMAHKDNSNKEKNFVIQINELHKEQNNNERRNSFVQESKFEGQNDPANYQKYIEEGNRSNKNIVQKVYSRKYQVNKNSQVQQTKLSIKNANLVMDEEEFQVAIEELKFDSHILNQNQDYKVKLDEQKTHRNELIPTQSFVRNKKGDVFLKMNSFDSLINSQNSENKEQKSDSNPNQITYQITSNRKYLNPLQQLNDDKDACLSQDFTKKETSSLRTCFCDGDKKDKRQNISNKQNNPKENEIIIEEVVMNGNALNFQDTQVMNKHTKEIKFDQNLLNSQQKFQEKGTDKNTNINQRQSYLSNTKIADLDIENRIYYSKDDQENIEKIFISQLGASQIKKNADCKIDSEIEQKLLKLKELDEENPEKIWEKVISKDKITIYKKQIPNNPCVMVRAEAYIGECSQDEVFEQIYYEKNRKKWDKVTLGFTVIETLGEMQDIIYFYIDPGFGVTKRDFLQKRAVRKDYPSIGEITIVFFSTTHPSLPEKKGSIRAISQIAAYIIRPVKEGPKNCHLTIITQTDVKGQIPKYIVNFLSARAPAKWIESMKKGVFDHRKNKI